MKNNRETQQEMNRKQSVVARMNNMYRQELQHHYWRTIVQVVNEILARPAVSGSATECD